MAEDKIDLKTAFAIFKDEKHIDRPVMMGVLKDVFITQITKTFGSADNFDVIINVDKGRLRDIPEPRRRRGSGEPEHRDFPRGSQGYGRG